MMIEKSCWTCTLHGFICDGAKDIWDKSISPENCKLYNPRPRCEKCHSLLLIDQKYHYSKYTYCPECKTYLKIKEVE